VATLAIDDLAVGERPDGEVIELVRAQETELPQALDYDAMTVEARRATGEALRDISESSAIATIASDAYRRCRRALLEDGSTARPRRSGCSGRAWRSIAATSSSSTTMAG
jgi:hypothetical protein